MERKATCQCNQLSLVSRGEPKFIFMCHCADCQRRTGTSYNLGAWFPAKDVECSGDAAEYVRVGDSGDTWVQRFCPTCGTTLYWTLESMLPGHIGVAVGCFADPEFPRPTHSVFGASRHRWLSQPTGMPSHVGMLDTSLEET